jgi:two-component system chemotaxis response regulator CheY
MAKFRCLIVEDSPTMRQLIVFALKRVPELDIVEASDGVDALKKLPGQKTDLVLTDINMPIMDGLKLVSLMKNNPLYRDIPVVIITTEGAAEDREKGLALGARAYIPKPIQTNNLLKVVRDILGIA